MDFLDTQISRSSIRGVPQFPYASLEYKNVSFPEVDERYNPGEMKCWGMIPRRERMKMKIHLDVR